MAKWCVLRLYYVAVSITKLAERLHWQWLYELGREIVFRALDWEFALHERDGVDWL